ncbi:GLE1-domain-containing protein [Daldinia caldariorum]|uniref:GLE1-domain-containing protein n=1 Tax=Daldinia caldariorum TaxID=326644 RepID=UPI002007F159|nr:GLE1-domain-containing protein [Daldinia caldariorum]KAI1470007.1 GLE1-domain-containing protein [Daldinia caldariorum]
MAGSSPAARKSQQWSSPDRSRLSSIQGILGEPRNTAITHHDALIQAQAEHDRVREAAIRVYHDHELQEERKRLLEQQKWILEQQKLEEERIRAEERLRAEEERLRALKAKTVPKLPPEPPTPVAQMNGSATAQPQIQPTPTTANSGATSNLKQSPFGAQQPSLGNGLNGHANGTAQSSLPQPFGQPKAILQSQPLSSPSPFTQPAKAVVPPSNARPAAAPGTPLVSTEIDRYVEIHRNLKKLRSSLLQQSKMSPTLKKRMGDMRRELRKNMGQLVGEKGGNKKQIAAIQALLDESLNGSVPSELVDPSDYITDKREPVGGALHNEPHLPSLFLYLLNHFSKAVINQFINECGAQPKTADPIGVIVAMIFSKDVYLWRGKTLIDILMAKLRVVCPVLFGYRGSEKTENGRLRLGWKKTGAGWAPEQQHSDRMKGLGAGYAAIALRNFSNSKNTNPWPPSKYWASMAQIVNTPPAEISNTQCIVLRAMIESSEEKFIQFYGNAAIAALRKALVEFPEKAVDKTPGVSGLQVLAQILKRDIGLEL